ncbi:MAG: UDP-N-acetylmuramoyl-L-alanyl-D-glutamate--2,6-diaminopimelate ligase [Oscillospiraceae bacterium]|jgi:UDP-N-acetylmuramoyl-L-alanyl-D-glutamate--2,6-diaminopimelate ligase|nr:UDP-N-acetylmuramoyl-L-alanyl-D-glutamate--2,6-diaminopimelate ligase [Oscillospiraceae bacterium]
MMLVDLIEKTNIIAENADLQTEIRGISADTRTLNPGDIFVAVRGYEHDGHGYIGEAVRKGAACVLCEEAPSVSTPYVLVKNTRKALAAASAAWFGNPASKLRIVGVTGTNGKTTVTCLIKHIIEQITGAKVGLIGTNGNMIGNRELHTERTTPESHEIQELLSMMVQEGCRYAVMEVSSHALSLDRVYGIEFEVGVFTNLTPDHLDFHDSMEDYAQAKAQLFQNSRNTAANIDDDNANVVTRGARGTVWTYALKRDSADLVAKNVRLRADRVEFCALTIGNLTRIELHIPGICSVYNALSAVSASLLLGFGIESVAAALRTCSNVKGRSEVVPTESDATVLIDYAHTPDALEKIIKAAREFSNGRVVTLFGCGGDRDKIKRPLMGGIAAMYSDFVVVTSDNPRTEEPGLIISDIVAGMENTKTPYRVIENRREAIHWALGNSMPGDILILAGKGHETYQIFGKEKRHFDEREVVAEFFSTMRGSNQ